MFRKQSGFTLIELLVVIAIIGLLASVVLASLNSAREKGADARRKSDLKNIQLALELYYEENETYSVSDAGYNGNGNGWFSHEGGNYPKAVGQQLADEGLLGGNPIDPSGDTSTQSEWGGYMIAADDDGYTLWAHLADPSTADEATLDSCRHDTYDNTSGMNYCISN